MDSLSTILIIVPYLITIIISGGITENNIDNNIQFFNFKNKICSGSTIVKYNNKYTFVQNIPDIPKIYIRHIEKYHFVHFLSDKTNIHIGNDIYSNYEN